MLNANVQQALNDQIRDEFYASYLYLSIAAYFEDNNLPGMASWMRLQADEERGHAMKIYDFVIDRGGRVYLQAVDEPPADFGSPLGAFEGALAHEQRVTASINRIYALAVEENDYPTQVMLQWFIDEQVEEEKSASDIVDQLNLVGDNSAALFMLDQQLGSRAPGEGE